MPTTYATHTIRAAWSTGLVGVSCALAFENPNAMRGPVPSLAERQMR